MTELSSKFPPVDFPTAERFGISEPEWIKVTKGLGRNPNEVECCIIARLWSDDCSARRGRTFLRGVYRDNPAVKLLPGSRAALFEIGFGESLAVSFEQVSNLVQFDDKLGARAGIGRAVDELISIGAEPLALVTSIHVGDSEDSRSVDRLEKISEAAAELGRTIGSPVVSTDTFFDARYDNSPLVACGVVGVLKEGTEKKENSGKRVVLYIGNRTRREGALGEVKTPVVDPYFSELIKEALNSGYKNSQVQEVVHLGVGGLARGVFDLALKTRTGVRIYLNSIPTSPAQDKPKALGLLDILMSESAERYLVIVDSSNYREFSEKLSRFSLEVVQIGELLKGSEVEFNWNHQPITLLPFQLVMEDLVERSYQLARFPPMLWKGNNKEAAPKVENRKGQTVVEDLWVDLLAHPNIQSQAKAPEGVDRTRGRKLLSYPGSQAAIYRMGDTTSKRALALTVVSTPRYSKRDPYLGAVHSVAKGMRSLAALGALPSATAQALFVGDPNDYKQLSEFSEVVRGASDACKAWLIPILTDSVRFSPASNPPIPTAVMLLMGVLGDYKKAIGPSFVSKGDKILLLGNTSDELGESQLYAAIGRNSEGAVPDIDFDKEKRSCECLYELIQQELLVSAHSLSLGGLAVALAEAALLRPKPIGFQIELTQKNLSSESLLFSESASRFILTCKEDKLSSVKNVAEQFSLEITGEGTVGGKEFALSGAINCEVPVTTASRVWSAS